MDKLFPVKKMYQSSIHSQDIHPLVEKKINIISTTISHSLCPSVPPPWWPAAATAGRTGDTRPVPLTTQRRPAKGAEFTEQAVSIFGTPGNLLIVSRHSWNPFVEA
ncbi:unnamed protein product [Boreogadus saida]